MKIAIIYTSQTGFTEKYANWLKEELLSLSEEVALFTLKKAKKYGKKYFNQFDAIIYGGWCCAGGVTGSKWFYKNFDKWAVQGKKLALWVTGGNPITSPDIPALLNKLLSSEQQKSAKAFYCQGGFNYDRMNRRNKRMMKMFIRILQSKPGKQSKEAIKMISHSYDISDKKYIIPIVEYLQK